MHALEEKIAAVDLVRSGMTYREASRICGMSRQSIWRWRQELDRVGDGAYPLAGDETRPTKGAFVDIDNLPDDPEELKKIIFDLQFELDLKEAIVDMLKKDPGVHLETLTNKEKSHLVDALATKRAYSIGQMTSYLQLAPATFYYHRKRMGADPEADVRERVRAACAENPAFGYRRIKRLVDEGAQKGSGVSEKRIRRIMGREGLQPSRRRKTSRYSSYDSRKDNDKAIPNIPLQKDGRHDFAACAPNTLWVSDVTEFHLPNEDRVFLSLPCWTASTPCLSDGRYRHRKKREISPIPLLWRRHASLERMIGALPIQTEAANTSAPDGSTYARGSASRARCRGRGTLRTMPAWRASSGGLRWSSSTRGTGGASARMHSLKNLTNGFAITMKTGPKNRWDG